MGDCEPTRIAIAKGVTERSADDWVRIMNKSPEDQRAMREVQRDASKFETERLTLKKLTSIPEVFRAEETRLTEGIETLTKRGDSKGMDTRIGGAELKRLKSTFETTLSAAQTSYDTITRARVEQKKKDLDAIKEEIKSNKKVHEFNKRIGEAKFKREQDYAILRQPLMLRTRST
jgi:hypothetical protein